jgi:hypothetical protein
MDAQQNSRLHDWIAMGKQSGQIREARTVVLAYCMDEHAVLPWIVDVVQGRMRKRMRRSLWSASFILIQSDRVKHSPYRRRHT